MVAEVQLLKSRFLKSLSKADVVRLERRCLKDELEQPLTQSLGLCTE